MTSSAALVDGADLCPHPCSRAHRRFAIIDDSRVVSRDRSGMEEVIDLVTGGEEMLRLPRRHEPLHPRRSCHYAGWCGFPPDCGALVPTVLDAGCWLPLCDAPTIELVGDHDARHRALPLRQLA